MWSARLLVVLALIAGLLGMHALVVAQAGHVPAAGTSAVSGSAVPHQAAMSDGAPVHTRAAAAEPVEHPQPADHGMLHLCLAILAELLIVVAVLGPALGAGDLDVATGSLVGRGRRQPPQRPPPTSVRLAQLCVMRN